MMREAGRRRPKHEVEPAYVAKSEPAIWRRGVERADVSRQAPIYRPKPWRASRDKFSRSRTSCGEAVGLTEGLPYVSDVECCRSTVHNRVDEETSKRTGKRGQAHPYRGNRKRRCVSGACPTSPEISFIPATAVGGNVAEKQTSKQTNVMERIQEPRRLIEA